MRNKTLTMIMVATILLFGFYSIWVGSWAPIFMGSAICVMAVTFHRSMTRVWIPLQLRLDFLFPLEDLRTAALFAASGNDEWLKRILREIRGRVTRANWIVNRSVIDKSHADLLVYLSSFSKQRLAAAEDFVSKKDYKSAYIVLREANEVIMGKKQETA